MNDLTLISGGCSFSECFTHKGTWPKHLANILGCKYVHTGLGSQGNGMISRKVLYAAHQALQTNNSEDLLVGISWSGPDRHEQYVSQKVEFDRNTDGWATNPVTFVDDDPGGWIIYNSHWTIPYATNYYKFIHDMRYSQILTLEHILRVQNYLELKGIRYFMTTYTSKVLNQFIDNPSTAWLYDQINWDMFLPVTGIYEWARDYSGLPFPGPKVFHPTKEQHLKFTQDIIMPFLNEKYKISINM